MVKLFKKYFPMELIFWLIAVLGFNGLAYYGARVVNAGRVHYDISIALDKELPLIPSFTIIYFGCYLTWAIAYIAIYHLNRQEAKRFYLADIMAKLICLAIFLAMPTTMARPEPPEGFFGMILSLLYEIDAPDNLFPSIHCLESWFGFVAFRKLTNVSIWVKIGFFVVAILVFLSTLFTKQHLLADVAAGILLAEICWFVVGKLQRRYLNRKAQA